MKIGVSQEKGDTISSDLGEEDWEDWAPSTDIPPWVSSTHQQT